MSPVQALVCTHCHAALPRVFYDYGSLQPCPTCGDKIEIHAFSAIRMPDEAISVHTAVADADDAVCSYHPEKQAVIPCDYCGRFLCSLCDIDFEGSHICPACFEGGRRKKRLTSLENERFLYDCLALRLAILPMLIFYFTIITAPVALFLALRHWNSPPSIIARPRRINVKMIVALLVSLAQILAWIGLVGYLLTLS